MKKTGKILSVRNPLVKETLKIKKAHPREGGEMLIEGPNLLGAALWAADHVKIKRAFYTSRFAAQNEKVFEGLSSSGAELYEAGEQVIERLSDTKTPQGVVAVAVYAPSSMGEADLGGLLVVSDGIQDPGNLGTIIRTSEAVGAKAVIVLPGSCDPFGPKCMRSSAGSVFNIPVLQVQRKELLDILKRYGIPLAVTLPDSGEAVFEAEFGPKVAIAFGNEAGGISPELSKAADLALSIPVKGRTGSLNVAAAAAVCLYEAMRRSRP